ncbi:unnamed protein product [Lactuca saligna]|uniref:Uncharacterized protein n=1 Tax=Lactuca saligna TaxID=75948 RepID=A0AA35UP96_LACSI|nr:unnamed protein product [Lactuca saligna]
MIIIEVCITSQLISWCASYDKQICLSTLTLSSRTTRILHHYLYRVSLFSDSHLSLCFLSLEIPKGRGRRNIFSKREFVSLSLQTLRSVSVIFHPPIRSFWGKAKSYVVP